MNKYTYAMHAVVEGAFGVLGALLVFVLAFSLFSMITGCNGNLKKDVHDLQSSQDEQNSRISALENQLTDLDAAVENCASDDLVELLQTHINAIVVQIATLQGYKHITAILDPCGNAAGIYDEVLLKLSDGKILASFSDNSSGKNTRFSIIPAGSYVTTDGSSCRFEVNASGNVSW